MSAEESVERISRSAGIRQGLSSITRAVRELPTRVSKKPAISYKHRLTLSPWDKFRQFRRFPFKLTLNLLVTVLCTARVILATYQYNDYVNGQHAAFDALFKPDPSSSKSSIYTIDGVLNNINGSVHGYFDYASSSVTHMSIFAADGQPYPIVMTLRHYVARHPFQKNATENFDQYPTVHTLTASDPLGPLGALSSGESLRSLFDGLATITIEFRLDSIQMGALISDVVYRWRCRCTYDLASGGGQAQFFLAIWKSVEMNRRGPFFLLDLFSLMLAICSIALTLKALHQSYRVFVFARSRLRMQESGRCSTECESVRWESLSLRDRVAFFNLWYVVTTAADVSLVLACSYAIAVDDRDFIDSTDTIDFGDLTRAAGCFLQWLNLMKYFEWRPDFYVLVLAVRCSLGRVFRFIVTSAPLYMGYALAGVVLFSNVSDKFGSLDNAAVTLFALVNGDSIFDVFTDLAAENDTAYRVLSRVYLYSFCTFFITTVVNVFIFIIEDGYRLASSIEKARPAELVTDTSRLKQILDAAHCVDFAADGQCMYPPHSVEEAVDDVDRLVDSAAERMRDGYAPLSLDEEEEQNDAISSSDIPLQTQGVTDMLIDFGSGEGPSSSLKSASSSPPGHHPIATGLSSIDKLEAEIASIQSTFSAELVQIHTEFIAKVRLLQLDAIGRLQRAICEDK
eukprot:Opistho-2@53479